MSCGVTITFSSPHSGLSWGSGSSAKTSSAAPLSVPSCSRSTSAASSITAPRPTLTSTAPGLTAASVSASSSPRVASVSGSVTTMRVGAADERPQLAHRVQLVDVRHAALEAALDGEHVHAERAGQPRGLGADGADADQQQRLAAQLADRLSGPPASGARAVSAGCCGRSLANASRPKIANSASGPAWTPEEVVTVMPVQLAGLGELQRGAELLAGAGVAGLHPAASRGARRARSTRPSPELPGIPNTTSARSSACFQRGSSSGTPPSPLVSPTQRRGRQQLRQVGELDPLLRRDPLGVLRRHRRGDQDVHAAPPGNSNSSSDSALICAE